MKAYFLMNRPGIKQNVIASTFCVRVSFGIFTQLTINYKHTLRPVTSQVFTHRFRENEFSSRMALKYSLCAHGWRPSRYTKLQPNRKMCEARNFLVVPSDIILSVLLMSFLFANILYVHVTIESE